VSPQGEVDARRFSERRGLASEPAGIAIRDDAPDDLRALVAEFAYEVGSGRTLSVRSRVARIVAQLLGTHGAQFQVVRRSAFLKQSSIAEWIASPVLSQRHAS